MNEQQFKDDISAVAKKHNILIATFVKNGNDAIVGLYGEGSNVDVAKLITFIMTDGVSALMKNNSEPEVFDKIRKILND